MPIADKIQCHGIALTVFFLTKQSIWIKGGHLFCSKIENGRASIASDPKFNEEANAKRWLAPGLTKDELEACLLHSEVDAAIEAFPD